MKNDLNYSSVRRFLEDLFKRTQSDYGSTTKDVLYKHVHIDPAVLLKLESGFPRSWVSMIPDPFLWKGQWETANRVIKSLGVVGLYFFIQVKNDGTWKILRIGESHNFVTRFQQYRSKKKPAGTQPFVDYVAKNNKLGKLLLMVWHVDIPFSTLAALELLYILAYKPPYNSRAYLPRQNDQLLHPASGAHEYYVYERVVGKVPALLFKTHNYANLEIALNSKSKTFSPFIDTGKVFRGHFIIFTNKLDERDTPLFYTAEETHIYTYEKVKADLAKSRKETAARTTDENACHIAVYTAEDDKLLYVFVSQSETARFFGCQRVIIRKNTDTDLPFTSKNKKGAFYLRSVNWCKAPVADVRSTSVCVVLEENGRYVEVRDTSAVLGQEVRYIELCDKKVPRS